jgi:diacylglycerol kinase
MKTMHTYQSQKQKRSRHHPHHPAQHAPAPIVSAPSPSAAATLPPSALAEPQPLAAKMTDLPAQSPSRATFLRSFVYAWNGLIYALRTQRNARVHAALALTAVILGLLLHISPVEFAMVFVAITLVFIAEMFNTVAEACVDLVTQEYHPLARIAKDVAAGAVLLNAMLSVVIGLLIFVPHLWPLALRLLSR